MAELHEGIVCNGVGSGVGTVKGGGRRGVCYLAGERRTKERSCFKFTHVRHFSPFTPEVSLWYVAIEYYVLACLLPGLCDPM